MIRIVPSILCADFSRLAEEVATLEEAGADALHFDVMDGQFVPNITFGPLVLEALRKHTNLFFEAHLMIAQPERYIGAFVRAGADLVSVHQEAAVDLRKCLDQIRLTGAKGCVALNPPTPVSALEQVLDELDQVLIMSVSPGFSGQKFIESVLPKIREVAHRVSGTDRDITVEVDGGLNAETVPLVVKAGATSVVAGTSVFSGAGSRAEHIARLREAAERAREQHEG